MPAPVHILCITPQQMLMLERRCCYSTIELTLANAASLLAWEEREKKFKYVRDLILKSALNNFKYRSERRLPINIETMERSKQALFRGVRLGWMPLKELEF